MLKFKYLTHHNGATDTKFKPGASDYTYIHCVCTS